MADFRVSIYYGEDGWICESSTVSASSEDEAFQIAVKDFIKKNGEKPKIDHVECGNSVYTLGWIKRAKK